MEKAPVSLNRKRRRAIASIQRRLARAEWRIGQRTHYTPLVGGFVATPLPSAEPFIQHRARLLFRLGQLATGA